MNPVSSASGNVTQILNAQAQPLAALAPWLEPREALADRRLGTRLVLEALAGRSWARRSTTAPNHCCSRATRG